MIKPTCSSPWSRRDFLGALAASTAAMPFANMYAAPKASPGEAKKKFSFHVFSKHLQFLDYNTMAETAAEIGFDGVDLTVRPDGHVLPEFVERDLPQAVKAIKKNGLQALMMTTTVIDASNKVQQKVLKTAHEQGIKYYRTNWLTYPEDADLTQAMDAYKKQLQSLADLNQQFRIYGSYQNHSGSYYVGAPVWDLAMILQDINSEYLGNQYDIRHATVEGGFSWPLGLEIIHPHINTLVMKDFRWEKVDGQWKVVNTPIGEGMVDFPKFFAELKSYDISAPVSLHYEYEMPEHNTSLSEREKRKKTVEVMKKDLNVLKRYMAEARLI